LKHATRTVGKKEARKGRGPISNYIIIASGERPISGGQGKPLKHASGTVAWLAKNESKDTQLLSVIPGPVTDHTCHPREPMG
jgi:hypothetical protein